MILSALGIPPVEGSTEELPAELSIKPRDPKNSVQNAVIQQYATIRDEFNSKKDSAFTVETRMSGP